MSETATKEAPKKGNRASRRERIYDLTHIKSRARSINAWEHRLTQRKSAQKGVAYRVNRCKVRKAERDAERAKGNFGKVAYSIK